MAEPRAPEGVEIAQLVALWDCDERHVRRLAMQGIAIKLKYGRYDLMRSTRNYINQLRKEAARHSAGQLNTVEEGARLKIEQRRRVKLMNDEREGRLISLPEIEEAWVEIAQGVRGLFLNLPARLQFDLPQMTEAEREVCEKLVEDMLREVATQGMPKLPRRGNGGKAA